ncbi:probable flavin-containing monoamine oxidase A isoform X1 [Leptidea sinapis]|uniref:probable flavin-containing monoamine oxidase A isoform X1 n=1 Tax=Leptidea sinapis TaxID=189913 RepID=UPI0021C3481A|nr:probable flavin-containing monoamine oxidase A isoform X1 [Leptidea sinapis]
MVKRIYQDNHVKADVIVLGCSLPGIVTAHKLKKKFGDAMDVVVLDLVGPHKGSSTSKCNVAFQVDAEDEGTERRRDDEYEEDMGNVTRRFLAMYLKEFNIPFPEALLKPENTATKLHKLFECSDGNIYESSNNFYSFEYLNFVERFELNQYLTLLEESMKNLFQAHNFDEESDRKLLLYYDKTTMEQHLCNALLFNKPRDIMRVTIKLTCSCPSESVSVLFYLHQCYRTGGARNTIDGANTKLREKLLGYSRKRITSKLQQSVANITYPTKTINEIRTYADEQVLLKTTRMKGETNYICSLLAMALRPEQLDNIKVESSLISQSVATIITSMRATRIRKFIIQYKESFWRNSYYSGDILSVKGPIIWATERPRLSTTGGEERYSALVGYLKVAPNGTDSRDAVVEQIVRLFGEEAAEPVNYKESDISDIFIPRCGDYVALRRLTNKLSPQYVEWGTLDIYADGDVASALEAGHNAYLHLLTCLRPQAQNYEDFSIVEWPTSLSLNPFGKWCASFSIRRGLHLAALTVVFYMGIKIIRTLIRK